MMLDKTYTPKNFEAAWYKRWQEGGHFAADPTSKNTPYTIMMPPPNVTGSLHIGHALTFTLQDVLIRYHRMRSRDTLWQPGMDHAGIATQMVVERLLAAEGNMDRKQMGREAFIKRVWQWKDESGGMISKQLQSLGASPDWQRERFTLDDGLSLAVRQVFVRLYNEGLIYRDKRLVNWDPQLQTAISDLEAEAQEIDGHYWHIVYPLADGKGGEVLTIATTRPETMFGDRAVAVHPDDRRYKKYIGKHIIQPITGRTLPIIADTAVAMDKGTGAVKITPAHDFNDFEIGRRHKLPLVNIFDGEARLIGEAVPEAYQGLERFDARKKLVAELAAAGALAKTESIRHSVPHGDRSGVPVEPWLMDQWYVKAEVLAKPAIKAVEKGDIKFVPSHWQNTYFEWMRNIQPWCISRQLWWGHRIPAWHSNAGDGKIFVAMTEAEAQAQAKKHYGKAVTLTQDPDVLDTWFSSALWPFSTLGWPEKTPELKRYYPSDVLVTGFDIIFFWVARMIMMGMHFMDKVPFRSVYIHALVRDAKGQKMSKSKGNVLDPLLLAEKYGADALRFTLVALAAPGRDVKLAEERIAGYRNFATKIWNACRFLQMNGATDAGDTLPSTISNPFNRWIVGRLAKTELKVASAMTSYRFNDLADALYHFIWDDYCDWYVEFIKPLLAGDDATSHETRAVAAAVMQKTLHMLNPIMPYISEELLATVFASKQMLIGKAWAGNVSNEAAATADGDQVDFIIAIISAIRSLRAEMRVPPKATPELLFTKADADKLAPLADSDAIKRLGRVSGLRQVAAFPQGSAQIIAEGLTLALPLADILDFTAEKARLAKELATAEVEVKKRQAKLANPTFRAKAPADVVEENQIQFDSAKQKRDKLQSAIARLT